MGFAIFFLLVQFIVILISKSYKWNVNGKSLVEYTTGQTTAIKIILLARTFIETLVRKRSYEAKDREKLNDILDKLEKEYEELRREHHPIIMDSLLETINSLK